MLLASDLDGTLELREGRLAPSVVDTLHRAGEKGLLRVLITGRNYPSLIGILRKEDPWDYLCISSGAGILSWPGKRWLKKEEFSPQVLERISPFLIEKDYSFFALGAIPENHRGYAFPGRVPSEDFYRRRERYRSWELDGLPTNISQFIVILPDVASRMKLINSLESFPVTMIQVTSPFDGKTPWLEIFPRGVHKGSALEYLCGVLGLSLEDTAALGNDWNDLDMLEKASLSWVVPGSPEGLKNLFPVASGPEPLSYVLDQVLRC